MNDISNEFKPDLKLPSPEMVRLTYLIYILHGVSLFIGVTTAATVVGAFVFGWPSLIAVVLNYWNKNKVKGTYLESHFSWQIRTFWFCLLWFLAGFLLTIVLIGLVILALTGIWAVYRIARGWIALGNGNTVPA